MAMKIISPKFFGEQLSLGAFRDVSNVDLLSLTRIPVPLLKRFCNCKGILFPLDSKEEREQRAGVAAGEGVDQSAETETAGNGLTGEEILGVMERHPVLADVVNAVVVADTTPSDELHTKSAKEIVEANLKLSAKRHGWGSSQGGELSGTQLKVLNRIIFGVNLGGRPRKTV